MPNPLDPHASSRNQFASYWQHFGPYTRNGIRRTYRRARWYGLNPTQARELTYWTAFTADMARQDALDEADQL